MAVLLLVVGACGGRDDPTTPAAVQRTTTTTTASSATTTPGPGPTTTVSVSPTSTPRSTDIALLVAVRAASQPSGDRLVFEFRGDEAPGVAVQVIDRPVREDGSGDEVDIQGASLLEVRMERASGADLDDGGTETYTGPKRLRPSGTADIREVVRTGDFEAVLTWTVGLDRLVPYRVTTLRSPTRVVIDFSG